MPLQAKPGITSIKPYKPGESTITGDNNAPKPIKLSSNENALGSSPEVNKQLASILSSPKEVSDLMSQYPCGAHQELRNAIAKRHNLNSENIICGAGSDEIIALISNAFINPETEAIYSFHGFLMYKINIQQNGGRPIKAPEENYTTNLQNIAQLITKKTSAIFIANPNNPTSTFVSKDALEKFIKSVPGKIVIVLDCAYAEFLEHDPSYSSHFDLVQKYDNLVVTRTFSKAHGLASLRVGWCYCSDFVASILNRIRGPFNLTQISQIAATTSIQDAAFIEKSIQHNTKELNLFSTTLKDLSYNFIEPSANFFCLLLKSETEKQSLHQYLTQNNIITRDISAYSIPNGLRITIGNDKENEEVIKALTSFKNK